MRFPFGLLNLATKNYGPKRLPLIKLLLRYILHFIDCSLRNFVLYSGSMNRGTFAVIIYMDYVLFNEVALILPLAKRD